MNTGSVDRPLLYLPLYAERETQATEGATCQQDITGSCELLLQQLEQANETIETLTEELNRLQQRTSELSAVTFVCC